MKQIIWISLFTILFAALISACGQDSTKEMRLVVGPQLIDCQGGPQGKCYQVKYSSNADWVNFPNVIQGFEWEAGYEYELRVKVIENRPRNSDFIFLSYELIEVIRKIQVK